MAKSAIFVTFEGPEGSGKSTHIRLLARWLRGQGRRVRLTREPGGTAWSKTLRRVLLHTSREVHPIAELLMYEADRAQHMTEIVLPALKRGETVVCDRFFDSTMAYQGYGRGLNRKLIRTLNRIASFGRAPDLTILLDVPVERGLREASARKSGKDRLEKAGMEFHRRVRRGFMQIAAEEPRRFRIVRQRSRPEDTQNLIREVVERFFKMG